MIDWTDLAELSAIIPLIARVYPNGSDDVNHFHAAGGMAWVISELLRTGLLHQDIMTVARGDLADYGRMPKLENDALMWDEQPTEPGNEAILRPVSNPFSADGGMKLLAGNLGRCIMKTSAVDPARCTIEAPARVFSDQDQVIKAFKAGELDRDVVVVVRFQGPRANGMPELHKLTPPLGVLQDKGFKVALVTDGRMSGASGKVPAAIHLSPEALGGGPIAKLRDGDIVRVCAVEGALEALVDPTEWAARDEATAPPPPYDTGRELFALFRANSDLAEAGASPILAAMDAEQ